MDQPTNLTEVVKNTVRWYAAGALNARTFFSIDEDHQTYVVTIVSNQHIFRPALVVMARVENDKVVIEEDLTDRPLVDALIQAGIPREQIVLAYAGEKLEEPPTPVT